MLLENHLATNFKPAVSPTIETTNEAIISLHKTKTANQFKKVADEIDWTAESPAIMKEAIDLAFARGCFRIAAYLAAKGHALFPADATLERIDYVVNIPKEVFKWTPANPDTGKSIRWLEEHGSEYEGQWVAIRKGELLMAADTHGELYDRLRAYETQEGIPKQEVLVALAS
jgi:hypothetical protein